MPFTREEIRQMKEDKLRQNVLIPLFKQMSFQDVFEYHGGPQEQGKDIVMWRAEEFRERTNFAVVVKATRITGQAAGQSSANEVSFQITQAFGDPFRDRITGEERRVQECIVVSSREISKEAVESISSFLRSSNLEARTTFWDGDKLWALIEKYFPAWFHLNELIEMQKCFDSIDPHYRLTVNTAGSGIKVSVEGKPEVDNPPPLRIGLKLSFPPTVEGQEKLRQFEAHLKTGAPVSIPESFLEAVELPEVLKKLFGDARKFSKVEIGAAVQGSPIRAAVEVISNDGETVSLSPTELKVKQAGSDEITFSNEDQNLPWTVLFVCNFAKKRGNLTFAFNYEGANVHMALQVLRFHRAFTKPGSLRITDTVTGIELVNGRSGESASPNSALEEKWIDLFRQLDFIQNKTHTLINFPATTISGSEVHEIYEVAEILRTGKARYRISGVRLGGPRKLAENIVNASTVSDWACIVVNDQEIISILGSKIPLGRSVGRCRGMALRAGQVEVLREQLKDGTRSTFEAIFEKPGGTFLEKYFLQWLSAEEAALVEKQIPPDSGLLFRSG